MAFLADIARCSGDIASEQVHIVNRADAVVDIMTGAALNTIAGSRARALRLPIYRRAGLRIDLDRCSRRRYPFTRHKAGTGLHGIVGVPRLSARIGHRHRMRIRHVAAQARNRRVAAHPRRAIPHAARGPWYRSRTLKPVDSGWRNASVVAAQALRCGPVPVVRNGRERGARHRVADIPGKLGIVAQMVVPQQ